MKETPLVSVIIPTYNCEKYISDSIYSALNQTYPHIEVIVIDDGSTDETSKKIFPFLERITYIKINHSGLPAVPRNIGIRAASGKYIAFLDADDYWSAEKISTQVKIFNKNPDVGVICSNAHTIKEEHCKSEKNPLYLQNFSTDEIISLSELLTDNVIINSSVLVKRELLLTAGFFSENEKLRAMEDYHLWLRLAIVTKIYFLISPFVYYRDLSTSIRSEQNPSSYYEGMYLLLSDIEQMIHQLYCSPSKNESHLSIIRRRKVQLINFMIGYNLHSGKYLSIPGLFFKKTCVTIQKRRSI